MNGYAAARPSNANFSETGVPPGFDELASAQVRLVDVYFGNRKVAETLAVVEPGLLRFRAPGELLGKLPDVIAAPELGAALAGKLPVNRSAACSSAHVAGCGVLAPETVGIIYDEDHFRVDLFVNPRFLRTVPPSAGGFLPTPSSPLALTSAIGIAAAGSFGGRSTYNIQNRTVVAFRNARIRTSNSFASRLGWVTDDLVAEVDRRDLRYSAGLFWAPGDDFTGQRRIIGAGAGTQFDTWTDRETLAGTPLVLFLPQPARVEIVVDGRLVSSRSYAAGNNELDTAALPDGSYAVLLRIRQEEGSSREERRFFVKNAHVPPAGHPILFAYAGMLANTRAHRPVSVGSTLYYHAGAAWRLGNALAVDVAAVGTQHKAIGEAGVWLMKPFARLRVAALASSAGDTGALVQLASAGHGPLSFTFDLRRIWSQDGKPLLPLPSYVDTFDGVPPTGVQLAVGSYTQAIGSLGLRVGAAYLSVVGTYRRDARSAADYSIGPSLSWPVMVHSGMQLVFEASGQKTRHTAAGFAGLRMLFTRGATSVTGTFGRSVEDDRDGGARGRSTGSITAQYSRTTEAGTLLTAEAGAERNVDTSAVHAGGTLFSRLGNGRFDLLDTIEGQGGTQYDVSFQSGLALSAHAATLGARQTDQSAILVSVRGDAKATFKVLVNDVALGRVSVGQTLPLFVQGYRTYRVRLLPVDAAPVDYDAGTRAVTLYPGNVQPLQWDASSYITLIAQAVSGAGAPLADALVQSRRAVAQTDDKGFFQIDVRRGEPVSIARAGAPACLLRLPALPAGKDYASVGKVSCQ